jgi:hypothetical protein
MTYFRRTLASLGLAALVLAATGCGQSSDPVARTLLVGKVTVNKKPVQTGTVTAYSGSSKVMEAGINPDGTYEFANPSSGEYHLTVTKTETPTPYGKPVKLPAKYADPAQSGLTATVSGGQRNTQDLTLDMK